MNEIDLWQKIAEIIAAENERTLTLEEKKILDIWLGEREENRRLYRELKVGNNIRNHISKLQAVDTEKAYSQFLKHTNRDRFLAVRMQLLKVAAVITLIISLWFLYDLRFNGNREQLTVMDFETTIEPGTSKATLQLADGTMVNLEEESKVIDEEGTTISNNKKEVVYAPPVEKERSRELKFNTIAIPRGGEYQLTLSDGTKVWLNSETTIKYPVAFSGKKREVFISGEAYFEVTRNEEIPFIVHTERMNVKVLGTTFNVRAYNDEEGEHTTLVEGRVQVKSNKSDTEYLLHPNDQFNSTVYSDHVQKVAVESYVAWKEGRIFFENNSLDEILTNLSRWYDLSVEYSTEELKHMRFSIDMKRYDDFSKFMEIVELTGKVKFQIEESEVTVLKGN